MAKTRTDAWGMDLPEETRWELYALSKAPTEQEREEGRPWLKDFRRDVLPHLAARGIPAPSQSSWYRFLGRMERQEREDLAARTIISVGTAKKIADGVVKVRIDPRLAAQFMTALSVDAASRQNDEAAKILADSAAKYHAAAQGAERLRLEAARQRTAEEQLRLAREKFEAAEKRESAAKAAVKDEKLSDKERMARLKEIYGI